MTTPISPDLSAPLLPVKPRSGVWRLLLKRHWRCSASPDRHRGGRRHLRAVADAVRPERADVRRPDARRRAVAAQRKILARHRPARPRPATRILYGARTSLIIGIVANGAALLIGTLVGITAGYFRGWIGGALMRFTDLMMAFPALLLAICLAAILQPSLWIVALVIALVNWVQTARVIYTETSSLAEREFIDAERTIGASTPRILFRHILPHLLPTIIVWGTLGISTTVLLEATLSYLGIGVQPPTASWGNIIFENQTYFQAAPWLVFFPGAAILALALAFNLVGDALRDILDPTQRGRA